MSALTPEQVSMAVQEPTAVQAMKPVQAASAVQAPGAEVVCGSRTTFLVPGKGQPGGGRRGRRNGGRA